MNYIGIYLYNKQIGVHKVMPQVVLHVYSQPPPNTKHIKHVAETAACVGLQRYAARRTGCVNRSRDTRSGFCAFCGQNRRLWLLASGQANAEIQGNDRTAGGARIRISHCTPGDVMVFLTAGRGGSNQYKGKLAEPLNCCVYIPIRWDILSLGKIQMAT